MTVSSLRAMLAGLLALPIAACGHDAPPTPKAPLPPAAVVTRVLESHPRTATEDVVGTVRAKLHAILEAKISGTIDQMVVSPGQSVSRGALVARIDAREVQARLDQAVAVRQQAEDDLERYARLLKQNIVPQADYDAAQSRHRVAEGAVREAETLLGYTEIKAPFDGTVTRKYANVGDLAAPGKPLVEIEDSRTLRLEADVPEAVVGRLALGDQLPVHIAALAGELQGRIAEISPAADPVSRTFLVKLELPPAPGLRAGQFGRVAMPVGETSGLLAPASAVVLRGQMEIVFVVRDGKAGLRIVKTGKRLGDQVELVSGVEAGEALVTEGAAELTDGQAVRAR